MTFLGRKRSIQMDYPIDPETIKKNTLLPVKLAELSYHDPDKALELLRAWGEGRKTIKHLWDDVTADK
jgi:hypothetical protein